MPKSRKMLRLVMSVWLAVDMGICAMVHAVTAAANGQMITLMRLVSTIDYTPMMPLKTV